MNPTDSPLVAAAWSQLWQVTVLSLAVGALVEQGADDLVNVAARAEPAAGAREDGQREPAYERAFHGLPLLSVLSSWSQCGDRSHIPSMKEGDDREGGAAAAIYALASPGQCHFPPLRRS